MCIFHKWIYYNYGSTKRSMYARVRASDPDNFRRVCLRCHRIDRFYLGMWVHAGEQSLTPGKTGLRYIPSDSEQKSADTAIVMMGRELCKI